MSYATLMVHLELGRPNNALLKLTGDLAVRLHAAVIGVAACQPMRIIYNDGYVPGDIIEHDREQIGAEITAAETEFRAAMADGIASVEWRADITFSPLAEYLAREACRADLLITGVDRNASMFDTSRHVDIGHLVMQAGRPCLIVPPATEIIALDHVVVGWKDSGETRRAIRDALPLLKVARQVTLVSITPEQDLARVGLRLRDVAAWLLRHGIEAKPVVLPSVGEDAVRLNAIVQELSADLLVAGAYGHSRVREWALGGVTRDLLLRAGRCALVSH